MMDDKSSVKVTVELNPKTNLEELTAHLFLMQSNIPASFVASDELMPDFSIHEGELALEPELLGS